MEYAILTLAPPYPRDVGDLLTVDDTPERTVFSLSDEVPAPLDFADSATPSEVLARGAVGELCSVRKLSKRGAVLHLGSPVEIGQHLGFELMNGRQISGTVSWVHGSEVILRFSQDLDVLGVIAAELVSQPGERRRLPRVELQTPVKLQIGPRVVNATVIDVSQGGLKIALREHLDTDTPLTVALTGFRQLPSTVRWCEGGFAGVNFDEELSWQEIMPWLRGRSAAPARVLAPALPDVAPPPSSPSVELNIPAKIREGMERWNVAVMAITTTHVEFESFTRPRFGTLISVSLPGLPSWPGRVASVEGDRWKCEFAQPLHPAVLERMLAGRSNA